MWRIPNIAVPAGGFSIIWFDKMSAGTHAGFRMRSNRELILLSNSSGVIIDSVRVEFPFRNCSYGRYPDGSGTWKYFIDHSQGSANASAFVEWKAPEPIFSHAAGRHPKGFLLTLTTPDVNFSIRYTTDGSEPVESSTLYTYPIAINKTTTVKARCFARNVVPGEVIANTYFINEHLFTIPVVSLSLDPNIYGITP